MAEWYEYVPDIILCPLYIILLVRLATASDEYFKSPFFKIFIITGVYSVITVISYQIVAQFPYSERHWTIWIYKTFMVINAFAAKGAVFGKATIAVHRYYVMRRRDFGEKKWSLTTIRLTLGAECAISLLLSSHIWFASYVYKDQEAMDEVIALSPVHTLILKVTFVSSYFLYILCNGVLTGLTCRDIWRLGKIVDRNNESSEELKVHLRHMCIMAIVCSVSHFAKALHQMTIAVATYCELINLYNSIWRWYPLVNGLAAYAAPIFLVALSPKVRARLRRTRQITPELTSAFSASNDCVVIRGV